MATAKQTEEKLNAIFSKMEDITARQQEAEEALNDLRIANAEKLARLQIDLLNKKAAEEESLNSRVNETLLAQGISVQAILKADELAKALKAIDDEYAAKIAAADKAHKKILENERKAKKKKKEKEIKEEIKDNQKLLDEIEKAKKKKDEARKKEEAKSKQDAISSIMSDMSTIGIGRSKRARAKLEEAGITGGEATKAMWAARVDAAYNALANFAKQLEGTASEIAEAQSEIDTRLWGSKNNKSGSSYWKEMSDNITRNVGMSPFIKQADAVNNLKTLVGKGIAFNVEQRAFLDTISEKIATTFEATDASLLKLVRIQQADSTAARLGMESALTAFLNNMYETTEYMTEAADSIRASIYEASALMTAEEATDFEYQVQKWMGSLYSVGFNNTQGLADALGKLAAGDIDSITDGGYGNLLVMAANKANLSIAEILADGLNDDETNALMQAMVDYLGGIYNETKDNKVVAQQFANVYGLTASDLKAAANLASSTTNVYKNNLDNSGMVQQLMDMANSMGKRTATGTMINNVFENLKYGMAATIGSNPVLYSTYMIANMLDEMVGGVAIPTIGAMMMGTGTEIDLETTVADLMKVAAVSGGIFGGLGKMFGSIGNWGSNGGTRLLESFGITGNNNAIQVTRGTGAGLLTTDSGMDISTSGFIGNEDGAAIQDKVITDEKDKANQQAIKALEEASEIGLSNVDEHVVQIYTLLNEVVTGSRNLHVVLESTGTGAWSTDSAYAPGGVPRL